MVKSLQLQAEMMEEFGVCVFDVTLDCEDGAPVGGEVDQANMVCALANSANDASNVIANGLSRRVGARLHAVDHPAFASDVDIVVGGAAQSLSYVMLPKVESLHDVHQALEAIDAAVRPGQRVDRLPLHVLIESPRAVHRAFEIAEHPRVQSLSFGLMDFVSAHGGASSHAAMMVCEVLACVLRPNVGTKDSNDSTRPPRSSRISCSPSIWAMVWPCAWNADTGPAVEMVTT